MIDAKITSVENLPGWKWFDYDDGSGHLKSPSGQHYFCYNISSYVVLGGIEYELFDGYQIYYGNLNGFKKYSEALAIKWRLK